MAENHAHEWEQYFVNHLFSFGHANGRPYTTRLRPLPTGKFAGYGTRYEDSWRVTDGKLQFLGRDGQPTTEFVLPDSPRDLPGEGLIGTFLPNPSTKHALIEQPIAQYLPEMLDGSTKDIKDSIVWELTHHFHKIQTHHRIRVAFVINAAETLPALLPLIKATFADPAFEPKVIALNKFYELNLSTKNLASVKKALDAAGIPYRALTDNYRDATYTLHLWQPDFLFRQSEWDYDYPAAFWGKNLMWTRLAMVPYVAVQDFVKDPNSQSAQLVGPYFRFVWRYFLPMPLNDFEQDAVSHSLLSEEIYEPVGSQKALMIQAAKPAWPLPNAKPGTRIVWMAHHSLTDGWFKFGTFAKIYKQMFAWVKAHPELSVVFNPHPNLRPVLQIEGNPDITLKEYDQFVKDFAALPNGYVLHNAEQYPVTAAADVILTDGISSLYEMQIQQKPVVGLIREEHSAFSAYGEELMRGVHVVHTVEAAQQEVVRLLTAPDELRSIQQQNTAPWLAERHPEQRIIAAMRKEMDPDWGESDH